MNRIYRIYCLWISLLVAVSAGVAAQDKPAGYPVETVRVCTDRSLYITGEKIQFAAFVINDDAISVHDLSTVLYCELVTPDGTRITGGKYNLQDAMAQGCLTIPDDAVTGIYYLKSYTRWMRNKGPMAYHYLGLKIINPDKAEVLAGLDDPDTAFRITNDKSEERIVISTDKMSYYPGDKVMMKIDGNPVMDGEKELILSVIPMYSCEMNPAEKSPLSTQSDSISVDLQYYPETRGISLSGRLLEDKTGNPVPNALVNLSIIGDKDVMAIRTDDAGRFYFALPGYTGNRDIFLCGEERNGIPASIFIDNDFCAKPVALPSPAFRLTEAEKTVAYTMAVNRKITSVFNLDSSKTESQESIYKGSFYGKADEVLVMDKYIDLPTIEEYFSELVGAVNVRKYEGRNLFRFNSNRTEMLIYDPLVLIDMVAVNDIEKVLAMSPRMIERIELVNAPYIKGNITYGGMISFFSKNNDFAGIDLPTSGTFVNYRFLEENSCRIPQDLWPENIPDARNTIYWDPLVKLNHEGDVDVSFRVPDTPGKYVIVLRGILEDDFLIRKEIEVKSQ